MGRNSAFPLISESDIQVSSGVVHSCSLRPVNHIRRWKRLGSEIYLKLTPEVERLKRGRKKTHNFLGLDSRGKEEFVVEEFIVRNENVKSHYVLNRLKISRKHVYSRYGVRDFPLCSGECPSSSRP